jgi:DNA-binding GntR family transcriptional regulator
VQRNELVFSNVEAAEISKKVETKELSNQVYDALLDMILVREMKAGDVVRERWLAKQLNVSRTPMRDALRRL